jgi:Domain of unknown function (DUF3806)
MLIRIILIMIGLYSLSSIAQEWRTRPISPIDQQYIAKQVDSIDSLSRRYLGRQLNGRKDNDLKILQQLLDKDIVKSDQVTELQAMGIVLGRLLKEQKGLNWVIYVDKLGRSRALQVLGVDEFIFPATQISRRAEVGIKVNVAKVYAELEKAVVDIRTKPEFF